MKNIFKISAVVLAVLVSFASCQKAEEIEKQATKLTHTVKFTTNLSTKTSYEIEESTVHYKWENEDINRLHVYEDGVEGTIDIEGSAIDESYVMLTVDFEGSGEGTHTYTANLNEGIIKSNQVAAGKYDSDCDVLVAKPVSSLDVIDGIYTFRFRRPVAITELKLKGLKAGEEVSKVTILSDNNLVGTYTQHAEDDKVGTWSETSNKITVTFGEGETKTVESDGSLVVPIVSMPLENASVKVLVKTESGLKYRKVTSPALTLTANNVKVQGIGMTQVTEAEHAEDGWYLVTDASELFDGDEIRIASPAKGMIAGEFAVDSEKGTQDYLAAYAATFTPETYDELTGIDSENRPNTFTLVENYGSFALVNSNGKLGTTGTKKMSYDDGLMVYGGVTEWTIAIADNLATISTGDDYGRILYNHNSGTNSRFLNYAFSTSTTTSMLLPQIYKKYGDAEDPIIKTARTASFSPESATVTIGADNNVFPTLSFDPEEATEGTQTWTSSNTDVATVNETTGEVTLVSDGTTTISVKIEETDTYQPCSASYELTVKPAEVEGVDYLDRDWTGIKDGSTTYAAWSDKVGSSSGNTYVGNSAGGENSIQLRTSSNSGIVVTNSASNKVARKIIVDWNSKTVNGRTLDIYGKSRAYSSVADLFDINKQGTELGSISQGTSTELEITDDYEYIGIRSHDGALYLNWIKIQWEDAKPEYEACFKNAGGTVVTEVNATVGEVFSAPTLFKGTTSAFADAYESSNTEVATVGEQGAITLKKKGDAIITATLNGDNTHKTTKVSYTIHVANKLSSIKLADDSEQSTTFYVGQDFSFAGIKVEATYSDGEEKTLTNADLTSDNFSGFDSSAAVESQTITVSYTDEGTTKTTTYNIEIKPSVTLYGITVPEPVDGNSITVKGGLTEAAEGDEIELDVNLVEGYKLTSLKLNDVEHSSDVAEGKYTFTMPAAAVTVTAVFDNHYNVVLNSATNGTFTVNAGITSPVNVEYGTIVNLVATPADGYVFKTWTVEGATVASATANSTSFTMPANDVTVSAEFDQPKDATYFYESFNKFSGTGGNSGGWSGSIASTAWGTTDVSGWTQTKGNAADKCAKFGTGSAIGSAETPKITISTPTAKLMFKAGAWDGSSEETTLNLSATGASLGQSSVTLVKGSWSTYTIDISNITEDVKIKFEAAKASNNRFFLDEVYVYYGNTPEMPKEDASWGVDPISVKVDETKDISISTNYTGTLSVKSKDESKVTATISGKTITVKGISEGTTTLIVTGDAIDVYNAINKEVAVTVTAASSGDDSSKKATLNSISTKDVVNTKGESVSHTFEDVTCTVVRNSSNQPGFYTSSGIVRYYSGDVMTLSVPVNYVITKIEFTMTSGTVGTASPNGLSTDNTTWTGSANSVSFTGGGTVKISSIIVTYSAKSN